MANSNLDKNFENLLNDEHTTEQSVQDCIEENPSLFYAPFELNHGIHDHFLISKFQLDTSLTTDLAYLTKSSVAWWFVLVELIQTS